MNKVDLVILGLIFERERHGYEIIKEIRKRQFAHWASVTPASVYEHLAELERKGALSSRREKVGRQPERIVYALKEMGRRMLSEMVLEALSSPPHGEHLEFLGMGFVYCADYAAVLDTIRKRIDMLQQEVELISREIEKNRGDLSLNWILLMETEADYMQLELRVFRRLAEAIESGALARSPL
ncbi:MAG: hypothetical protein DRP97_08515 [Candidatus Latescibacterota bacterium]|nr:MAG: hypothetical protein DRP97_08515 [Candidatus Latescibacterota bacterium]